MTFAALEEMLGDGFIKAHRGCIVSAMAIHEISDMIDLVNGEKLPLEKLIGQSFGTLFSNMDAKWLRGYERTTLYGETLELMDYSPEIDTHLKVICFPTFKGHCGCILFDVDKIWFVQHSEDSAKTLARYYAKLPNTSK